MAKQKLKVKRKSKKELSKKVFTESAGDEKTSKVPSFTPDKELIDFAIWFSKNFRKLKVGDYYSKKKKYHIKYWNIVHLGKKSPTTARSAHQAERFEFNKRIIAKNKIFTENFIFYMVLWCRAILEDKWHEYSNADIMALKAYMKTGRSRAEIVLGWIEQFRIAQNNLQTNDKRLKQIVDFLNKNIK